MIYASPYGGRRYHADPVCTGLNSTALAQGGFLTFAVPSITRAEAARRGLTPCGACKPPPLLTVITTDDEGDS